MNERKKAVLTGLFHETNTYIPPGSMESFQKFAGQSLIDLYRGTSSVCGGYIDFCEKNDIEMIPTGVMYLGNPCGLMDNPSYQMMKKEILDGVRQAQSADMVLLYFHGAAVVEGLEDPEADVVKGIRDIVGHDVKIIAMGLDLHGKCSKDFDSLCDWVSCVHRYPHIDFKERVLEGMAYIPGILDGTVKPARYVEYLPLVFPPCTTMGDGFGAELLAKVKEIHQKPHIIDFSYLHGFPYADTQFAGGYVLATTNGDKETAEKEAKDFAKWVWSQRERLNQPSMTVDEAVRAAVQRLKEDGQYRERPKVNLAGLAGDKEVQEASVAEAQEWAWGFVPDENSKGPIVIHDTADNPGGGTAGRGTYLLRRLLEENLERTLFFGFCDPVTAKKAHGAGVGAIIEVDLGGGGIDGEPVKAKAVVMNLSQGRLTSRSVIVGQRFDVGLTARLLIGSFEIIVTSVPWQGWDNTMALLGGVDFRDYRVVALKSSAHFRAYFTPLARVIITADGPGGSTGLLSTLHPARLPGPVFPFILDAKY